MKLKSLSLFLAVAGLASLTACNDYDYDTQLARTDIATTFAVRNSSGNVYNSRIDGDNITIKINPFADVQTELASAVPVFCLPMGATCSPSPCDPQDFTKEVKYTITSGDGKHTRVYTVNWGPSDPLPEGQGYSFSRLTAEKLYNDLGYPGTPVTGESAEAANGDLLLFPAFCGDKLVCFSRVYAWGNTNGRTIAPDASLAFKVFEPATLDDAGVNVNLGTLSAGDIVNVCNDWHGHMVAATGGVSGKESALYYWTSVASAPIKVCDLPSPVYTNSHEVDASMFIQVAGDITADAAVSYMPVKTATGEHVVADIRGGQLAGTRTITTGYASNDQAWFQMVSLFGWDEKSCYLVGDTEGNDVKGYYNSGTGMTLAQMPCYINGKTFSDGVTWWSGYGKSCTRGGGRRPFMMAMVLNGKEYALALMGYDWSTKSCMMTGDFGSYIGDALNYDSRRLETEKLGGGGLNAIGTFGSCGCWYWDADNNEGRVAIWNGREGLATFLLSSYE